MRPLVCRFLLFTCLGPGLGVASGIDGRSVTPSVRRPNLGRRDGLVRTGSRISANAKPTALVRGGSGNGKTNDNGGHGTVHLMSAPVAIFNIVADLCPHGMLPLAYGIAAGPTGTVLAVTTVLVFGLLGWYSLVSFGRAADVLLDNGDDTPGAVVEDTVSAVWSRAMDGVGAWIPDAGVAALTFGCCLFYSAFLGDLFGALARGALGEKARRWHTLLTVHAFPILPLCLLRDLSALMISSVAGLAGILYTAFFVGYRCLDRSYAEGGTFFARTVDAALQPLAPGGSLSTAATTTSTMGYLSAVGPFHVGKGTLTLMNMCCVAFACHYNAVKYYMELKGRTVRKFGTVVGCGVLATAAVFVTIMLLGYATFGSNAQTLLLNNYHSTDAMANAARALTGLAIMSGYPLMFSGLKFSLHSLPGTVMVTNQVKTQLPRLTCPSWPSWPFPLVSLPNTSWPPSLATWVALVLYNAMRNWMAESRS